MDSTHRLVSGLFVCLCCCVFQRVIQMNTLEDRAVTSAHQWDDAVKFMESTLTGQLKSGKAVQSCLTFLVHAY